MVKFSTRCVVACLLTIGMCFLQYNLFFRNFKFKWWIDLGKGEKSHLEKKFPSALIVGVRKGGTRALLDAIALHPKVRIVRRETHFFDSNYTLGFDWYRDQMPEVENDNEIVIEKTPAYFTNEHVPKRVYEMNPDMKLILIVRHPVYRTVSDFTQVYYNKLEQNKTLPVLSVEAFKTNEAGIEKINMEYKPMTNSLYDVHISKWLKYFDLKNFLFVNGDVFRANPLREVEYFKLIACVNLFFSYGKWKNS
uniref:Heparan sulfate 3-O sulfotransferase isoform b n=1 Tax=Caenorhabditis elegans TaxID=6239 RepID=A7UFE1_CAEEL|nr:heparan sulfate 3-O sulfotransferase isoform b [Caenorhabditis elegans]